MGIVNAVLVEWGDGDVGGYLRVEDATSITAWERREAFLALRGVRSAAAATEIGEAFLETRKDPRESLVVQVDPADEPAVGDIIDVDTDTGVRVVGSTWELDRDGVLVPSPEVSSLLDQRRLDGELAVERLTAAAGWSAASDRVAVTGSRVDAGRLEEVHFTDWSTSGEFTAEDLVTWQDQPVRVPCRVSKFECTGKPAVSGDNSEFELLVDGASFSPPITISLPYNDDRALVYVFNEQTLFPGSVLAVECTQLGAHTDVAVTVHAVKGA